MQGEMVLTLPLKARRAGQIYVSMQTGIATMVAAAVASGGREGVHAEGMGAMQGGHAGAMQINLSADCNGGTDPLPLEHGHMYGLCA